MPLQSLISLWRLQKSSCFVSVGSSPASDVQDQKCKQVPTSLLLGEDGALQLSPVGRRGEVDSKEPASDFAEPERPSGSDSSAWTLSRIQSRWAGHEPLLQDLSTSSHIPGAMVRGCGWQGPRVMCRDGCIGLAARTGLLSSGVHKLSCFFVVCLFVFCLVDVMHHLNRLKSCLLHLRQV